MVRKRSESRRCELTTSQRKRAAADRLAASVKDGFPAGLAQPALRALARAGYTKLEQLSRATEADVLALHGMGPHAMATLRAAMAERGVRFRRLRGKAGF